jgi:peptidoglycan/LPS O-acetylase OafA/YrhL
MPGRDALVYRPDIDGLRGVAVGLVVAYHAFPQIRSGGFIGVDVFFVISGYLITQLVLTGLHARTFSLAEFYRRRVRRIVPALLLVMAVSSIFGWLLLLPSELQTLGKSIAWCAAFLANLYFATTGGYFDRVAELKPLLHLWSLGVEEQFYLAWPLLLMLVAKRGAILRVLAAVIATSLAFSIWSAWYGPGPHFYNPASRAWELAVGGMLAAWPLATPPTIVAAVASNRTLRWADARSISLAGLALIVIGGVYWSADKPIPGLWSVIPTAGAALLIGAGPHATVNRYFLASRPMTFIGRISYPLYLWHWPLFSFIRVVLGHAAPPAMAAGTIVIAFAAAYATYRLVEAPIRYGEFGRKSVPALLAGLALLALTGALANARWIAGRLSGPSFTKWDQAVTDWYFPAGNYSGERPGFRIVTVPSRRERKALFIGDSHIQQYWPRVMHVIDTHPDTARSAVFVTYPGCLPLPGIDNMWRGTNCSGLFDYAVGQAFQPDVDTVVFGAFWEEYLLGEYSANNRRQRVYSAADYTRAPLQFDSPATRIAFERFQIIVSRLVSSGRRVFIVLSNPTSPLFDPVFPPMIRLSLHFSPALPLGRAPRIDAGPYESYVAPLMSRLQEIAAQTGAHTVDPRTTLCDGMVCPAAGADGMPLYLDSNHLGGAAARARASFVDEMLLGAEMQSSAPLPLIGSKMPPFKQ